MPHLCGNEGGWKQSCAGELQALRAAAMASGSFWVENEGGDVQAQSREVYKGWQGCGGLAAGQKALACSTESAVMMEVKAMVTGGGAVSY